MIQHKNNERTNTSEEDQHDGGPRALAFVPFVSSSHVVHDSCIDIASYLFVCFQTRIMTLDNNKDERCGFAFVRKTTEECSSVVFSFVIKCQNQRSFFVLLFGSERLQIFELVRNSSQKWAKQSVVRNRPRLQRREAYHREQPSCHNNTKIAVVDRLERGRKWRHSHNQD